MEHEEKHRQNSFQVVYRTLKQRIEKHIRIVRSSKRSRLMYLVGLFVFFVLLVFLSTYKTPYEYRSRAAAETAQVYILPSQTAISASTLFRIMINSGTTRVGFIRIHTSFDPAKLELTQAQSALGNTFTVIQQTSQSVANSTGSYILVLGLAPESIASPLTGSAVIGELTFQPLVTTGSTEIAINVSDSQLGGWNADDQPIEITITPANSTVTFGSTSVTATNTPTPTPAEATNTPTHTPTPTVQETTVTATVTHSPTPTLIEITNTPTPTPEFTGIPNPPGWWSLIPEPLRDFLELLYMWIFYFGRFTPMYRILEGIVATPTPTPLP